MEAPRLKAGLLVRALIRQCMSVNQAAYVTRKGDDTSGAVLIKRVSPGFLCVVFQSVFVDDGQRKWMPMTGPEPVAEAEADAFVARQTRYDEDLWVVEVEAPDYWTPDGV